MVPALAIGSPSFLGAPPSATFVSGALGAATEPTVPFSENVHTASPSGVVTPPRLPPVATVTYCVPSTEYVIGGAPTPQPVWKVHSVSPELASSATRLPSNLPRKTSPPAVASAP